MFSNVYNAKQTPCFALAKTMYFQKHTLQSYEMVYAVMYSSSTVQEDILRKPSVHPAKRTRENFRDLFVSSCLSEEIFFRLA